MKVNNLTTSLVIIVIASLALIAGCDDGSQKGKEVDSKLKTSDIINNPAPAQQSDKSISHGLVLSKKDLKGDVNIVLVEGNGCNEFAAGPVVARLEWDFPAAGVVKVMVPDATGAPNGLLAMKGAKDVALTGRWVAVGAKFYFVKDDDGVSLGTVEVIGCE